ncbi:MAG: decaprenyl-phosphate phosphoribosyltransferase [Candidatus Sumerlaeota bacterium]|nr:decaprenyl-phosphate phosphoribosyltransferase [Candidatus Sumerlaeota bacterium]
MKSLYYLIIGMRPKQWTKNFLLFAGVVFTHNLSQIGRLTDAVSAFIIFCGLSGVIYLFNDLRDGESDRQHPLKCQRPIASGQLSEPLAWSAALIISVLCIVWAFFLNPKFGGYAVVYFIIMVLYSAVLKHVVILDLLIVAIGFVIRAMAGVRAIELPGEDLPITPWFITCILFLALFIVICKRRHELILLADSASSHRPVLEHYSPAFLDQMVSVATTASVLSYALYVVLGAPPTPKRNLMIMTLPFVLYGIFRYLYLVYKREEGGSPENMLLRDIPMLVNIGLWAVVIVLIFYWPFG